MPRLHRHRLARSDAERPGERGVDLDQRLRVLIDQRADAPGLRPSISSRSTVETLLPVPDNASHAFWVIVAFAVAYAFFLTSCAAISSTVVVCRRAMP